MMKRAGRFWVPSVETQQVEALKAGGWQLDHLAMAMSHVPAERRGTAVDGGAHVGSWTLEMTRRFDTVWAFEPHPETFECLEANAAEWREENPGRAVVICLHKCALGAESGRMGMADDTKYAGGNTGGRHLKGTGTIAVRPLDVYRLNDLDFFKLDVEGFEFFALKGAEETIKRCRPVVMIEDKHRMAHRYALEPGAAGRFLLNLGMVEVGAVGADRTFGWPT